MKTWLLISILSVVLISGCITGHVTQGDVNMAEVIEKGDMVAVNYKGYLADGEVFDSSEGRDPLSFEAGAGQMIKGFDDAVIGMSVGQEKKVEIPTNEAYGQRDESLVREVSKEQLGDIEPEVGMQLIASNGMPVKIAEVNGDKVKIDFNHPLAGKDLIFDITIVSINDDSSCDGNCSGCDGCQ